MLASVPFLSPRRSIRPIPLPLFPPPDASAGGPAGPAPALGDAEDDHRDPVSNGCRRRAGVPLPPAVEMRLFTPFEELDEGNGASCLLVTSVSTHLRQKTPGNKFQHIYTNKSVLPYKYY